VCAAPPLPFAVDPQHPLAPYVSLLTAVRTRLSAGAPPLSPACVSGKGPLPCSLAPPLTPPPAPLCCPCSLYCKNVESIELQSDGQEASIGLLEGRTMWYLTSAFRNIRYFACFSAGGPDEASDLPHGYRMEGPGVCKN